MPDEVPTNPLPLLVPQRSRHWLWLAVAAGLLALLMAGFFLSRGTSNDLERRVRSILNEARQQNRNTTGFIGRLLRILPNLFASAGAQFASGNYKGPWEYAQEIEKLGTNTVPILMRILTTDENGEVRGICARVLGNVNARGAVPLLSTVLARDKAQAVRYAAAEALGEINDEVSLPALRAALNSETDGHVRSGVVSAFAAIGHAQVVPELLALGRKETNWQVRANLARALASSLEPEAIPMFTAWFNEKPAAPAPSSFMPSYNPNNYSMREVIHAAGEIGGEAAYQLLAARWQEEPEKEVRVAICETFGALADPRALPMLREALEEEDETRAAAVTAIGQLGDTNAVPILTPLLNYPKRDVRRNAAAALGHLRGAAGVPTLLKMLEEDGDDGTRAGIARALGEIGDPSALGPLLKILPTMAGERESVLWALGHLGHTDAVPILIASLKSKEREESFAAAYALAEIGGGAGAEALAANLADKDEFARHGKACALAMLGRRDGLTTVKAGLRAKEQWRRFGAIIALARLGLAIDATEWEQAFNDPDPSLRQLAREAAAGRVVPALIAMLHDRKSDYRHYAARGLLFFNDSASLAALREACKDRNASVRDAARLSVRFIERTAGERR